MTLFQWICLIILPLTIVVGGMIAFKSDENVSWFFVIATAIGGILLLGAFAYGFWSVLNSS